MTAVAVNAGVPGEPGVSRAMSHADLAEVMSAFNDATGRLHAAHERLTAEVSRLKGELREAGEQLERARRLSALGEMAAGIAHEVRNPLASIRLYARMLEDDLGERPEQKRVAGKIAAAAQGLDAVVTDVLSFAREVRVRREGADAGMLIGRALEACEPLGAGVRVERHDRARGAVEVPCDAGLAGQAVVNIVRNAIEAMEEAGAGGGARVLSIDAFERTAATAGGGSEALAVLSVSDTGPGVPEGVMERMFNPFFTTRPTGTGLGLAIVHRIMDAHGGRIVVKNNAPGPGATVELMFPMEEPRGGDGRERPVCRAAQRQEALA